MLARSSAPRARARPVLSFLSFLSFMSAVSAALALLAAAGPAGAQSADTLYRTLRGVETPTLAPAPAANPDAGPAGTMAGTMGGTMGAGPAATAAAAPMAEPGRVRRVRTRDELDPEFRLGVGDVLSISVLEDSSLDRQVLVRPDGRISMPLAGAPMAAGRTPEQVAAAIRAGLSDDFIEPPTVTVSLVELGAEDQVEDHLPVIYVLGEVNRPGGFTVNEPVGLLQALALAGGPGVFAAKQRMQVRRTGERGVEEVLVVDYEALEEGAAAPRILLGDGDTVVVPERGLFE